MRLGCRNLTSQSWNRNHLFWSHRLMIYNLSSSVCELPTTTFILSLSIRECQQDEKKLEIKRENTAKVSICSRAKIFDLRRNIKMKSLEVLDVSQWKIGFSFAFSRAETLWMIKGGICIWFFSCECNVYFWDFTTFFNVFKMAEMHFQPLTFIL